MTILSEMSSAVLPYSLKILVQKVSDSDSTRKAKTRNRRTLQHYLLWMKQHKRLLIGQRSETNPTCYIPSISSRLSLLMNHSAAAFALCGSVRSIGSQTSSPLRSPIPSCSIRPIAYSAFSLLLAARYTFAPRLTRWRAMYRPIPELYPKQGRPDQSRKGTEPILGMTYFAPVTMATRPFKSSRSRSGEIVDVALPMTSTRGGKVVTIVDPVCCAFEALTSRFFPKRSQTWVPSCKLPRNAAYNAITILGNVPTHTGLDLKANHLNLYINL